MSKKIRGYPVAPDPELQPDTERTDDGTAQPQSFEPLQLPDEGTVQPDMPQEPVHLPDQNLELEETYGNVAKSDPDHAAKVIGLARKMNMPEAFIDKNLPDAEKASKQPSTSLFAKIEDQYPGTTAFLKDPRNMAVTHDDIENVAKHEQLVKAVTEARDVGDALKAGFQGSVMGMTSRGGLPDTVLPADAPWYHRLAAMAAGLAGDAPTMIAGAEAGSVAGASAGAVVGLPLGLPGMAVGAAGGAAIFGAAGAFAAPALIKKELQLHYQNGDIKSFAEALDRTGQGLNEATKQGIVGVASMLAGGGVGLVAGKYVGNAALRAALPVAAEVATMTKVGNAIEGKETQASDYLDNLLMVGAMHGSTHIAQLGMENYVEAKQTKQALQFYDGLTETAGASKLLQRLPEQYRGMLGSLTKDSPVESVYIPQESFDEYFQSKKIDPGQAAEEMGIGDAYKESQATGGDITIPTADFVTNLAKTPEHYQGLRNDVKFSPDAMTAREITSRQAEIQEQLNIAEKEVQDNGGKPPERTVQESADKLYEERYKQLIDAGRSAAEAKQGATLHERTFRALAERTGADPYELSQRFKLEMEKRQAMEPAEVAAFNQEDEPFRTKKQGEKDVDLSKLNDMPVEAVVPKDHTKVAGDLSNRKTIEEHVRSLSRPGSYENAHTGEKISINADTRKKLTQVIDGVRRDNPTRARQLLEAVQHLPELTEKAILLSSAPEIKGDQNTSAWHYIFAPLKMDGKSYLVRLDVQENSTGAKHVHSIAIADPRGLRPDSSATAKLSLGSGPQGRHSISEFKSLVNEARKKNEYFQPSEGDQPRGRIKLGDEKSIIQFFKDANRSTFLHESGHYFLEVMKALASDENAPEQLKKDYQTALDWMGVKPGEEIKTEHHEQWARGFEAYLMEGKAPSNALRQAFARFKQWLVSIYKTAKGLNVEMSPEIREVMDRMLATDEEIKQAQQTTGQYEQNISPFKAKADKDKLMSLADQARDQAESILMKEKMKEISEERKKFMEDEKARLQAEAEAQVSEMPVFKAQNDIQEALGTKQNVLDIAAKMIDGTAKDEDATHFEIAAEVNGFADGKELANEILSASANKSRSSEVIARVNAGLKEHYDSENAIKIKEEAMKAVHNEKATELLALEKLLLESMVKNADQRQEISKRNRVEARVEAQAAQEQAKQILDAKPIKDAGNARIYITAERNAAAKAAAATTRKDFAKAAEYKRQQMLNHALAAEAMRNREASEKAVDYLNEASKRGRDLKDMPYGFNRQVDQLLQKFGLKEKGDADIGTLQQIAKDMQEKGEDQSEIANRTGLKLGADGRYVPETLPEFISRVNDNFTGLVVPDSIVNGAKADFRDMTMTELSDLKNSVKAIIETGKKWDRFLSDYIQVDRKTAAEQFSKSVLELIGAPYADNRKIGSAYSSPLREKVANLKNLPNSMISTMVNTLTLCTYLDGGKNDGPAHEFIYRPLKQAEDRKFARYAKMREELSGDNGLIAKHYTKDELANYKKAKFYNEQTGAEAFKGDPKGRWLTKEQILSMALNWGNEGNRQRIRAGFGARDGSGKLTPMSDETIQSLFKQLGKKDWDFAQATWDHLETYWPEISALEMKINGVEPERVKAAEFSNEHGSYRGGYYPIAYDFEKSSEAFKNAQDKTELFKSYSAAAAHTETGHTQARVSNVSRPVRLSLDVLFNHLENVVHDLEFRPAVIDVNKFLSMRDVKSTLENSIGMDAARGIENWLKAQGSDQSENLTWLDKALTWTRFGTTISALGLTPKAFLLHAPSNFFQMARELGWKDATSTMTQAALDVVMGRGELKDFVFSRSERMKQRLTVRDRDIMDMAKAWQGTASVIPHYAFMSLHLADEAVSVPLWAEIYKRNVAELGESAAKELADETVTRRLGSGSKVDQIGAMRGSGAKKIFTMFYSWMSVMFNNAWLEGKLAGLEYRQDNIGKAAAIMAKATLFGFALPAIHEALLAEALRNSPGNGDDKDRAKRIAGHIIEYPFANVLFARDIAPPIIHRIMGERGGDYKMSPVEMAYQNLFSPVADGAHIAFTSSKHFDERYAEEVARGVSQVGGYPQQLNTWAFNLLDFVQHNGEASMKDFLSRRRKK